MFFGVPTMYHRLAATGGPLRWRPCACACRGRPRWQPTCGTGSPPTGVAVLERYGMTETLVDALQPARGRASPGSVGLPLPGVEAALDDVDEQGIGELLRARRVALPGLLGRASTFAADDWFATGDLASVADDGYVSIRGRRTELIITGGHNVYPAEVEAVLARHPGVVEVAVVGLPSAEWGETVVAYVVGDPDLASLRELAAAELAPFKCPREVRLIDALPRNALGKVVRSELR